VQFRKRVLKLGPLSGIPFSAPSDRHHTSANQRIMQVIVRPQLGSRNLPPNSRTSQAVQALPILRVVSPEGYVRQIFPPPAPAVVRYRPDVIRHLQASRYADTPPAPADTLFADPIDEKPSFLARIWNKVAKPFRSKNKVPRKLLKRRPQR